MEPIARFAFLLGIDSVKVRFYISDGPEKSIWGCKVGGKKREAAQCKLRGTEECLAIIHSDKIAEWRVSGVIKGHSISVKSISVPKKPSSSEHASPCA
jgi:hypothetical protein